ncbi:hypothetical protein PLICRDRAFT_114569 [Plicaturopsis crispa FD-325 SS-3]|nr:hypothetical protein PLICRDRAFT_114569 [Plicaturopsis crispa FD-325 SS-3]
MLVRPATSSLAVRFPAHARSLSRLAPPHHRPHRHTARRLTYGLAAALGLGASYTLGSLYPHDTFTLISPRAAPAPPAVSSPEALAALENALLNLPVLQRMRAAPDADEWYETRPYAKFPEERRVNNLTAGALRGQGKLGVIPLARVKKDESESAVFIHVGRGLCGHDGIVHGGLLATLLDETLARTAINNLPEKVGVTAKLSLNYRAPTRADQFIVIKTKILEQRGRKAVVEGRVEDLDGSVLVEANATFVQPRYAKLLSAGALREAMGEPMSIPPPPSGEEGVHLADGVDVVAVGKQK